jgi:ribonucleoside-diphosphate reductase alpha chain
MKITSKPTKIGTWSESAVKVLRERYLQCNERGEAETPEEMCWRVALAIAQAEQHWGKTESEIHAIAAQFYDLMVEKLFLPNSPTLMNAGTGSNLQYSACYVLPIEDSIEDIFEAIKQAAIVHQSGGGTGFSFSRLRPRGSLVRTTGGVASGPVSFMRAFDAATETIKQGGRRRGANMGVLRVDHPDILEFIDCKLSGGITNFNISVAATDRFMETLAQDEEYDLVAPHTGQVTGRLRAKDVFDRIVRTAWATGDPGMIFIDRINRSPANPTPELVQIESTNPCVTGDTWVTTTEGARQVKDLIGHPFTAIVYGAEWPSEDFFSTGTKQVYKLTTAEGFSLRLTAEHPLLKVTALTRYRLETEWTKTQDLQLGDQILIHNHRNFLGWKGAHTEAEGYLTGFFLGDGTINDGQIILSSWGESDGAKAVRKAIYDYVQEMPHRRDFAGWSAIPGRNEYRLKLAALRQLVDELGIDGNKAITPQMEQASVDFYRGLLRGLFDTDGSVQGTQEKGVSVRLAQSDLDMLRVVQRMLLRLGIASRIYQNRRQETTRELPDGKGGIQEYPTKAQHELVIAKDNLHYFCERIGFGDTDKARKLAQALNTYQRELNRERFVVTIIGIAADGIEEVYDVHIPGINMLDANGLVVHNCGEQALPPNDACNLGSINLCKFARATHPNDNRKRIDWDELERTIRLAVRFLDDVIDVNPYPLKEIDERVKSGRRIGLGVMGWADLLFALDIPYDSEEALALAEEVMGFINRIGHDESARLAEERGPFPNWPHSIYRNGKPLRNSTVTCIAPTGTISIIAECSSGIEPVFALAFRHIVSERHLQFINPIFERLAKERGFYNEELMAELARRGTVRGLADVPEDVQRVFATAHEVSPEWHVRMQATFQKHTDNGVSKTVNMPNSATVEDVARVYSLAYELGCLGITVYRDGCKKEQVLHVGTMPAAAPAQIGTTIKPRPRTLKGLTYRQNTPLGTAFITVNDNGEGPFEVFVNVGRGGSDTAAVAEALGRLISLCLRLSSPLLPRERVKEIVEQLSGIGGGRSLGFGKERVRSLPDAIAQVLAEHIGLTENNKEAAIETMVGSMRIGDLCPECGQATLVIEEGCKKCHSCGYTEC